MQWRGSLFTNQELAIAYTLGFDEALFMQQSGVMLEGIGKYILSNARHFDRLDDVLNILKEEITKRQWRPEYSRHLVPTIRNYDHVVEYVEYDRTASHRQYIWHVEISNRRRDLGAMSTIAILDRIQLPSGETIPSPDRAYLKWAYQADHQRTIPPGESAIFDAFALEDTPTHDTVYLHSLSDFHPRQPVLQNTRGPHVLHYQVFAQGFPRGSFAAQ